MGTLVTKVAEAMPAAADGVALWMSGLSCRFGDLLAVDGLTLQVGAGEVFGLLGHNGAGKTTTIRLLTGLLAASAGSAGVLGHSPATAGAEIRGRTGVLTETPSLEERLTAEENLTYYGRMYGVAAAALRSRVPELLADFGLEERARDRVGTYSKGMKQRLALARALLHDPELLFLDEPTSALDPVASRQVHERVEALRRRSRTIVLCTHNLVEAQRLCHRVAVLRQGRLLALGTPAELGERYGATRVVLEV
ncbi:MAG TPA: ABC transporter ATP-binding protein, partial [Longimicrobiales bacterium]